jgi:hypothetical protein
MFDMVSTKGHISIPLGYASGHSNHCRPTEINVLLYIYLHMSVVNKMEQLLIQITYYEYLPNFLLQAQEIYRYQWVFYSSNVASLHDFHRGTRTHLKDPFLMVKRISKRWGCSRSRESMLSISYIFLCWRFSFCGNSSASYMWCPLASTSL